MNKKHLQRIKRERQRTKKNKQTSELTEQENMRRVVLKRILLSIIELKQFSFCYYILKNNNELSNINSMQAQYEQMTTSYFLFIISMKCDR